MDTGGSKNSLLEMVYVGNKWTTETVEQDDYMFYNCDSLVGELGTSSNGSLANSEYAKIDRNDGYFWPYIYLLNGKKINEIATYNESSDIWIFNDEDIIFDEWNEEEGWIYFKYMDEWYVAEFGTNNTIENIYLD